MADISEEIKSLESEMQDPNFWNDKDRAQEAIKKLSALKGQSKTGNKYDNGDAVLSIYSGAGGDDAEDWASMLLEMYRRFAEKSRWQVILLHHHKNETSGTKNVTFEAVGKSAYGRLRGESGVHRLVRISPFSARKLC